MAVLVKNSLFRFEAGEVILLENSESNRCIYVLHQGLLSIRRRGKEIHTLKESGEIFGEIAAITGKRRTASIHSMTESLVYVIPYNAEVLFQNYPTIAKKLVDILAARLQEYMENDATYALEKSDDDEEEDKTIMVEIK